MIGKFTLLTALIQCATFVFPSRAQLPSNLGVAMYAGIQITGEFGRVYAVERTLDLQSTNDWRLVSLLKLTTKPHLWIDPDSPRTTQRFYRASFVTAQPVENMVFIQPGSFTMGSPDDSPDRGDDEGPTMTVTIPFGFWMGIHEVTQDEYVEVTGLANPSHWRGDPTLPVESVTWRDATNFCFLLTERERQAGRISSDFTYRLPYEAEWEYACRAGTTTRFSFGDDLDYSQLPRYAWYLETSDEETHPVGRKFPNPYGLHDMHGNVWEWCADWYGEYPGGMVTAPTGPSTGLVRVNRGGSWFVDGWECRSAQRRGYNPTRASRGIGFRVVLALQTSAGAAP